MSTPVRIEELRQHLQSLVDETLETDPGNFSLRELIHLGTSHGYTDEEVKTQLTNICDREEIHELWSDWTTTDYREELRLRLELIRSFSFLPESLHDFITFYFRASDPVMYQTAALALGRHLTNSPSLKEYLKSYMKQRGMSPEEVIKLNGERSRRRVILTIASYFTTVNGKQDATEFQFPVSSEQFDQVIQYSDSDLNVFLIVLYKLLESKLYHSRLNAFTAKIISHYSKTGITGTDRSLARNWSRCLTSLDFPQVQWYEETCIRLLKNFHKQFEQHKHSNFSRALQILQQTDEILGSCTRVQEEIRNQFLDTISSEYTFNFKAFCLYRIATWHTRKNLRYPKKLTSHLNSVTGTLPESLELANRYLVYTGHSSIESDSVDEKYFVLFSDLARNLQNRMDWLGVAAPDKLYATFYLLDLAVHELESNYAVSDLISELERINRLPLRDKSNYPLALRVLLIVHNLESPGQTLPVDSNLIHQIPEPSLLYTLLPGLRQTDFLAVLADAFEHHLRLQLLRDPSFSVFTYFYRITIYNPNPVLFDILAAITKNRHYSTSGGTPVPVNDILEVFRSESRLTKEKIIAQTTWNSLDFSADRFYNDLSAIRNDLVRLHRMDDLFESLGFYTDMLDISLMESETGSKGLLDLIQKTEESFNPDGIKFLSTQNELSISDSIVSIRKYSSQIAPESIDNIKLAKNAAIRINEILEEINNYLSSKLGRVEKLLLRETTNDLQAHLNQWVQALDNIYSIFQRFEFKSKVGKENWDQIFSLVSGLPTQPLRRELIHTLSSSFFIRVDKNVSKEQSWKHRYEMLRSMALSSYRKHLDGFDTESWENRVTYHWMQLLCESMDSGFETRVQNLMDDPLFHFVYKNQEVHSLLTDVRSWFYDRYDVFYTQKLGKLMHQKGFSMKRELLTFRSYLLHFTNVWIALVIGAILMLDFGDAWMALAEIGDTTGVLITFFVGVIAAGIYLYINLKNNAKNAPEDNRWERMISRWTRIGLFLAISLLYTLVLTSLLWLLFSSTDEVVHGPGAILHILGWTGFALLVGIFFGLLSKSA